MQINMGAIVILLTVGACIFVSFTACAKDEGDKFLCAIITLILSVSLGICVQMYKSELDIQPIDVYKGKTELVYTVKVTSKGDTIKCDSMVVWKNK